MSHILGNLYVIAGVIFLFGAAIFVHEFGHYWVALKRGLKVEEFAIGFGPKIISWKRDGIDYSIRWIPAGGFVKLPQMITSTMIEGDARKAPVAPPPKALAAGASGSAPQLAPTPAPAAATQLLEEEPLPPVSALSKILVAVAGPTMNVVFAFALATLIYYVGLPVPINPPIVGYVNPKSPEGKLGIHEGDRIVAIDGKPVKSWDEISRTTILALTNVFQVSILQGGTSNNSHGGITNVYPLKAEAGGNNVMNFKMLNLESRDHLVVGEVSDGSTAAAAHLQAKDEIVSFAGTAISSHEEFTNLVQACGGKKTPIVIKRGEQKLTFELTPKWDTVHKMFLVGIMFGQGGNDYFDLQYPTPWAQVKDVWEQLSGTVVALVHPRESGVKASDLAGPVGIFSMLALQVKSDYRLALHFLVMLNINLAILNMLPIPVLDGGHVMMSILERIRRRPLEVRFVEYTTTAFAVLLISFMLYITFFDIKRLPVIHMLWNRNTQIEQPASPVKDLQSVPENRPNKMELPDKPAGSAPTAPPTR